MYLGNTSKRIRILHPAAIPVRLHNFRFADQGAHSFRNILTAFIRPERMQIRIKGLYRTQHGLEIHGGNDIGMIKAIL